MYPTLLVTHRQFDACTDLLPRLRRPGTGPCILVVGDIMLDQEVDCLPSSRRSESATAILRRTRDQAGLGGAGNVASNLARLGARVDCIGMVGDDASADELRRIAATVPNLCLSDVVDPSRPTTKKMRITASGRQILRIDEESRAPADVRLAGAIAELARDKVVQAEAVIVSDYGKGAMASSWFGEVASAAAARGIPVIVDPYGTDPTRYRGATMLKPNAREAQLLTNIDCATDSGSERAALRLLETTEAQQIYITRGEQGITAADRQRVVHFRAPRSGRVVDVCGAGDCAGAMLALGAVARFDMTEMAEIAVAAGAAAVSIAGVRAVGWSDLERVIRTARTTTIGICDTVGDALRVREDWRRDGHRTGFTNGCFDLLHAGHRHFLQGARRSCDKLILALNSDASIKRIKGDARPIQPLALRAHHLMSTGLIDLILPFETDTPEHLIRDLTPDVLLKGGDYRDRPIVGAEIVSSYGGEVQIVDHQEGHSTTALVRLFETFRASGGAG